MKINETLRKPEHWQAFEDLCHRLWGEIWQCAEIVKNGRLGQQQHGVDIYGFIPEVKGYFGIQCKGKSEYNDCEFKVEEIDEEIEKAKNFTPSLKKMYFATTAVRDQKIQAYVREKNLKNVENDLFEVHIFFWEDIVNLIDLNQRTHDYYVNNNNYKNNYKAQLTFSNGEIENVGMVNFVQNVTIYKLMQKENELIERMRNSHDFFNSTLKLNLPQNKIDCSYYTLNLLFENSGSAPIEEYKVNLNIEGQYISCKNTSNYSLHMPKSVYASNEILIFRDMKTGVLKPKDNILVGGDSAIFKSILIYIDPVETVILINWQLLSKNYKNNGTLKLVLLPQIARSETIRFVKNINEVRIEEGLIEKVYKTSKNYF